MTTLPINQAVDVHWQLPSAQKPDGRIEGDEVVRTFDNLIPACEFAVAMAQEGNLLVTLYPESGPVLDTSQAHKIKMAWESGNVETDATELEI
jgi:hypothetical protein